MLRRLRHWGLAAAVCSSLAAPALAGGDCQLGRADLRGSWGQTGFSVEIADDEQERAKGLMFRESMPRGAGMLFVYDRPQPAAFWMKNTLIPLDIIFLDENGLVTSVHENAIPGDLSPIPGGDEVFAVLEINGGLARRYGIAAGTQMRHQIFSASSAVWPC
ncbi:DUF192 domain-containing protein [Leisingera sp. S132]|uniref:DUF192 domain-containing protein n=1 Tax=Leisingera sp. S132 TaxID=2867016 RepID=UPI0021A338A0|nr:DUF192 domain-containing protein [Leisingera sp. S132]UWQ81048.1 DUF192 domain-containing protein [Leisingera sp. S132]